MNREPKVNLFDIDEKPLTLWEKIKYFVTDLLFDTSAKP